MIDYVLKFSDQATAKTALAAHLKAGQWRDDYCIGGLSVWRASQDVNGTDGLGNPTVTHTLLTGFFILVSLPVVLPALRDLAAVQVVIDRDMANAGQVGATIKSNVTNAVLQDLRFSPVFAGANMPFGNFQ